MLRTCVFHRLIELLVDQREEKELTARFGKSWVYSKLKGKFQKPVYKHNNVQLVTLARC